MNPVFFIAFGGIVFQAFMLSRFLHKCEIDLWIKKQLNGIDPQ